VRPTDSFKRFDTAEIHQSIARRFEKQVDTYSNHLALKSQGDTLTYGQLNQVANLVAHAILDRCGVSDKPVALVSRCDVSTIAGILGILKAGKICVPLDLTLPRPRVRFILEDSEAEIIVTGNEDLRTATELPPGPFKLISVDQLDPALPVENLDVNIRAEAVAWILYTSGSTGQPKGILQTHRDELHNVMTLTNSQYFSPDDRMTLLRNPSVGGAIRNMLSALLNGTSLFPLDIKREGIACLANRLLREEITVYHSAASVFRNFVKTLVDKQTFPKVRLIRLGSEPVTRKDVEAYRKHFSSDCILVNALSSTEARTFLQYFVGKDIPVHGDMLPVGHPVDDVEISIVDEDGRNLEHGQIGEIVISSRFTFPGYWKQPELTHQTLVPDPHTTENYLLKTGDLGRMLADGAVEYQGRKDMQCKIRGHRVQIDEVEKALQGIPQLNQVAVVAQDWRSDKRLIAYVVPQAGRMPKISELRSAVAEKLPDFMIPSLFVCVDSMPLMPTGKVDRCALPPPEIRSPRSSSGYVAPRTPVECVLVRLWSEALATEEVGVEDDFLELGGQSLLAGEIAFKLGEIFSMNLTPGALLQAATVRNLSKIVFACQTSAGHAEKIARAWLTVEQMNIGDIRGILEGERKKGNG
jgi:amino acid adenylation domain-containing protein